MHPTPGQREQLPQETRKRFARDAARVMEQLGNVVLERFTELMDEAAPDRKSTRLNSSH